MKKIIYTIFPSLMPTVWRTKKDDYITYKYDKRIDAFVGSNNVVLGLGYVIKNLKPIK